MTEHFDDDGFDLRPKPLGEHAWFYEGKKGLVMVYQAKGTLQSIIGTIDIPWSKLKAAIEHHQKFERRRKRRLASQ